MLLTLLGTLMLFFADAQQCELGLPGVYYERMLQLQNPCLVV